VQRADPVDDGVEVLDPRGGREEHLVVVFDHTVPLVHARDRSEVRTRDEPLVHEGVGDGGSLLAGPTGDAHLTVAQRRHGSIFAHDEDGIQADANETSRLPRAVASVDVLMTPPTEPGVPDDDATDGAATITEAAGRWAEQLGRWAIPEEILARAPVSPWQHDTAMFVVDDTLDRRAPAAEVARAVLPVANGSVLDVGCGGGRGAMALVPPAELVIGADQSPAMLAEFTRAAAAVGARSMTVEGVWPDVAGLVPVADVVVCHHVAYNVADIEPFLLALTAHARLAVVLVLPPRHPLSAWNDAWRHFWGLERPDGPTADDVGEILDGLGLGAERWDVPRPPLARATADAASRVTSARRRLCLTEDRDDELADYLDAHEPQWSDTNVVFRWPGAAGDDRP
jgi:SAM-dependent methyltransferase